MKKVIIGIDISSKTLDICLQHGGQAGYFTIDNELKSIKNFKMTAF